MFSNHYDAPPISASRLEGIVHAGRRAKRSLRKWGGRHVDHEVFRLRFILLMVASAYRKPGES
jgi:hypothetical protein